MAPAVVLMATCNCTGRCRNGMCVLMQPIPWNPFEAPDPFRMPKRGGPFDDLRYTGKPHIRLHVHQDVLTDYTQAGCPKVPFCWWWAEVTDTRGLTRRTMSRVSAAQVLERVKL